MIILAEAQARAGCKTMLPKQFFNIEFVEMSKVPNTRLTFVDENPAFLNGSFTARRGPGVSTSASSFYGSLLPATATACGVSRGRLCQSGNSVHSSGLFPRTRSSLPPIFASVGGRSDVVKAADARHRVLETSGSCPYGLWHHTWSSG